MCLAEIKRRNVHVWKASKATPQSTCVLKSTEDHLLLNQELSIPGYGTADVGMDNENLKPLTRNVCPTHSHLEETIHFTDWQND